MLEKPNANATDFEDLALLANWKMIELLEQLRSEHINGSAMAGSYHDDQSEERINGIFL